MGRARRVDVGGMIYHTLNRAIFRSRLFRETAHYADFLGIVEQRRRAAAQYVGPNGVRPWGERRSPPRHAQNPRGATRSDKLVLQGSLRGKERPASRLGKEG
jgi:hypothetical protein